MSWICGKPYTYGQKDKEGNLMHFNKILLAHEFHYIEKETCTTDSKKMFTYLF